MKPDDPVQSATIAIQTRIKTLIERLNSYLSSISSYVDAVSSVGDDVQNLISNAACEIAKYMKILFDKVMEYVLKTMNKALSKAVAALPTHMRSMFGDMKETITELILCLYGKITGNLCGLIEGILTDALGMDDAERKARENVDNHKTMKSKDNLKLERAMLRMLLVKHYMQARKKLMMQTITY